MEWKLKKRIKEVNKSKAVYFEAWRKTSSFLHLDFPNTIQEREDPDTFLHCSFIFTFLQVDATNNTQCLVTAYCVLLYSFLSWTYRSITKETRKEIEKEIERERVTWEESQSGWSIHTIRWRLKGPSSFRCRKSGCKITNHNYSVHPCYCAMSLHNVQQNSCKVKGLKSTISKISFVWELNRNVWNILYISFPW